MAEKLLLIWPSETVGVEELVLLLPEELDGELLPQAAMRRAALPATAVSATFLVTGYNGTTSLWAGTCQGGRLSDLAPVTVRPHLSGKKVDDNDKQVRKHSPNLMKKALKKGFGTAWCGPAFEFAAGVRLA